VSPANGIEPVRIEPGAVVFRVGSGRYLFDAAPAK
jgi:hypothetical protein